MIARSFTRLRQLLNRFRGRPALRDCLAWIDKKEYRRASGPLRLLADSGDAEAAYLLATLYAEGKGVAANSSESFRYCLKAAQRGHLQAADRLGGVFLFGAPQTLGARCVDQAITSENGPKDAALAALFGKLQPHRDYEQALRWNLLAAEQKIGAAQARLGLQYALGLAVDKDLDVAKSHFEAAAAQGDELGTVSIGMLHMGGFGGAIDITEARRWLIRTADREQSLSNVLLALTYLSENDENVDVAQASELLRPAAIGGNTAAMFYLGELYRRGKLVDTQNEGQMWLRRAASKGHLKAMVALVRLLTTGDQQSPLEAAAICRQAADLGEPEAMFLLAHLYLQGKGLVKNDVFALRWAKQSAEAGFGPASDLVMWLQTNDNKLSIPAQIPTDPALEADAAVGQPRARS